MHLSKVDSYRCVIVCTDVFVLVTTVWYMHTVCIYILGFSSVVMHHMMRSSLRMKWRTKTVENSDGQCCRNNLDEPVWPPNLCAHGIRKTKRAANFWKASALSHINTMASTSMQNVPDSAHRRNKMTQKRSPGCFQVSSCTVRRMQCNATDYYLIII